MQQTGQLVRPPLLVVLVEVLQYCTVGYSVWSDMRRVQDDVSPSTLQWLRTDSDVHGLSLSRTRTYTDTDVHGLRLLRVERTDRRRPTVPSISPAHMSRAPTLALARTFSNDKFKIRKT